MNKSELQDLINNQEDSGVEFKRDDVSNHCIAKELVALLNLEGGTVLLGVEDDGTITGTTREDLEEWVAELCRVKVDPPIIPFLSWVKNAEPGRDILAARVPIGPDKPYARVHNARKTYFIRVGSTSREASRDELQRMFQASGNLHYGVKPVPGAGLDNLDRRRLKDYLISAPGGQPPADDDAGAWQTLLRNIDLMTMSAGLPVATIDGMLLFGRSPKRFLPQSGIRAVCFPGTDLDYAARADENLRGPMVPLRAANRDIVELGLVDQAWDFVRRNTTPTAHLESARKIQSWEYPESVVREAVVNALVHRDYSIAGTDIMLAIFSNRLEITSPGRLPNTITTDGMKAGARYARNQTLVNIMRDYGYADARGMGVRDKIIPGMLAHNGTEPDLIAQESRFILRLWKQPLDT